MLPDASAYRLDFVALLLLFYLFLLWLSARGCSSGVTGASAKSAKPQHPLRPLKPRTPADCPKCVCECTTSISPASRSVRPWREYKSSRGRPKRIDTAVYACDNEQCAYCGITDATIHVLVGFGHHGVDHAIQNLFCQACQHKFSVRRHTALYRLKTAAPGWRRSWLHWPKACRWRRGAGGGWCGGVFGHAEGTITTWLTRAGTDSERLHTRLFRGLELLHVQLDELRTTLRNKGQEVWLWLALAARTKIIAAAQLGPRTRATAHALIHGLVQVLARGCMPLFTSDGLNLYFYSLTAHFGAWEETLGTKKRTWQVAATLLYGQLIKSHRRRKLARVERVMRCGTLAALRNRLEALGWRGVLQTAFVERVNLTIRRGLAMLAPRSWATTQTLVQLQDGFAWWRVYYHLVKPHESLRVELAAPRDRGGKRVARPYSKRTPAMAVGV